MKNIHVLATDQPSRLWINNLRRRLELDTDVLIGSNTAQHIYITSDEEPKKGNWYCHNQINYLRVSNSNAIPMDAKKIILTTDQELIADGVQAIDDEFLEWFVKNPSYEEVEVGYGWIRLTETDNEGYWVSIPNKQFEMQQEEHPKQIKCYCGHTTYCDCSPLEEPKQETLEEVAERLYPFNPYSIGNGIKYDEYAKERRCFIEGMNCQNFDPNKGRAEIYYNETFKTK